MHAFADEETKKDLSLLLDFVDTEAGGKGKQARKLIEAGLVTFPELWRIFALGELIYESEYNRERLFKLQRTGHGDSCSARGKYFELSLGYTLSMVSELDKPRRTCACGRKQSLLVLAQPRSPIRPNFPCRAIAEMPKSFAGK